MKFLATKKNNIFTIESGFDKYTKNLKDGKYQIEFCKKTRSNIQNNSLHLYFTQLAEELNDAGWDLKKTLREDIDVPWDAYLIKEYLWRPLQEVKLRKKSTTKLNSDEIDKIYEILNKVIGDRCGVSVPFPSKELMENYVNHR